MEFDCGIQYDRDALLVSISGVNDLLLVHGPNIFVSQESSLQSSRILYQEKDDIHLPEFDKITSNYVIEIFTDLLDNEVRNNFLCLEDKSFRSLLLIHFLFCF